MVEEVSKETEMVQQETLEPLEVTNESIEVHKEPEMVQQETSEPLGEISKETMEEVPKTGKDKCKSVSLSSKNIRYIKYAHKSIYKILKFSSWA